MSQAAHDIDAALRVYRDAIGTPFENVARANLRSVVDRVSGKREPSLWRRFVNWWRR